MSDPNHEPPRIGEEEPKQLGESSIISSGSGSGSGNSNPIIVNVPRRKRPRQGSGGEHTESGYAATTAKKKVSHQSNSLLKKPSSSSITSNDSLWPTQQSLPGGQVSVDSSGRDSTTTNTTTNNNREPFINTTAAPSVTNTNSSSNTHDSRGVLSPIFTPEHWAQQLQLQLQQRVLLPQPSTGVVTSTESSSARTGYSSLPSSSDVSTPQFSYQPPSAVAQMLRAHQASASLSSAAPSATVPSTNPATTKDRDNAHVSFTEDDPTHRHALNFVTSGQQQEQQHQGIFYPQCPATTNPPATASNATAQAGVPGQYYPLLLDGGQNSLLVTYAQAFSQMQQHHQGIQVDAAAAAVGQMHQTTRTNHQQNQLPLQVADVYTAAATGQPQGGLPTSMLPSLLPNFAGGVIPTQPPSNNTGETSSAVSILPFGTGYGCLRCRLAWFPSYEEAFNHVWLNCEGLTRSDIPTPSASNHPASQSTEQRQGTLSFGGTPHLQTQQHIHGQNNMNMPSIDTSVLGTFMGPHQVNAISLQSPLSSVPLRAAGASLISHANTQPHQWLRGVSLGTEQDCRKLSQQQCLIREQIEAFSTNIYDLNIHIRGRNKRVALGQVGIQCCHCSFLPVGDRSAGSVYFPSSVSGIYQAAQNMFKYHLKDGCAQMPAEVRELCNRITQSKSSRGGGKQYWATSAHSIGLADSPQGIRFQHDVASMPQQPSPQLSAGASDVVNQQVVDPYVQNLSLLTEAGQKIMKETSDKTILGMVLPRDKECLTTYLYMLFAQVKYCQLAQSDQVGFRRKEQNVGLPGLECKHCQGSMGCGRSFRSTSTSLAKNENIAQVFNHTLRCSSCPMDIKNDLTVLKERHGSEMSRLKRGWKKMFFDDLMRRLLNQRGEKSAEEKG